MAEALVSALIKELVSLAVEGVEEEVRLVKGVDEDVRQLKSNLEAIQALLEDAERRQLVDRSVRTWLDKLKDVSFDMDNVLDEWSTAILKLKIEEGENVPIEKTEKVCFSIPSPFSCFKSKFNRVTLRHDIAHKIKDLNEKLDRIVGEKDKFELNKITVEQPIERPKTTSFINETEIYGRDEDKDILVRKLLSENGVHQDKPFHIIPIVGMGGMGKTTLAQLVYNDEKVKAHFDKRIWVCVSDPFDEIKVAKAIVESIEGSSPNVNELETLFQRIREGLGGKRFLLILDDVWTEDKQKWDQLKLPFNDGAIGSRFVVTTRKKGVAIMMEAVSCMITLEKLSEEHCWSIFKRIAFFDSKEEECKLLEEIGRKVASKAKGSPLVAKTLGGLMCSKKTKTQWEDVLNSELWELKDDKIIFTPFLLSYYELSAKEKCCFSYCSVFPKDNFFDREQLIRMWLSQGYLGCEKEGHDCFETLVMRSFFQNFEYENYDSSITHCKMHDIVHDFAQFLTREECIIMEADNVEEKSKLLGEKARHLSLVIGSDAKFSSIKYSEIDQKNLRTLFLVSNINNCSVDTVLFSRLMFLRTLSLSQCGIMILPESIGRLIHLRYLNLSENKRLKELPDSLCGLCNLQTLKLSFCDSLERLPEGMGKLVNLKYLYINACFDLRGLPRGICSMRWLERLDMLVIAKDKGAYFDIGDLKKLNNLRLRDYLCLKECRNIENVDEAHKVDIKSKSENLVHLVLDFGWFLENQNSNGFEDDIEILEALEPHQNLAELSIVNYMGASVSPRPRWMMSLINLRRLFLANCSNCEIIPPFGKLPSLKSLKLLYMKSVKKVGMELLGITEKKDEEEEDGTTTERDVPQSIIAFPKLEELVVVSMDEFERWEGVAMTTSLIIMPCLKKLTLAECPRLEALPNFLQTTTSLKFLSISKSEIVEEYCRKRTGQEWDKISHVPNIEINDEIVRKDDIWIEEDNDIAIRTSSSAK